jgi:hypothetical protein
MVTLLTVHALKASTERRTTKNDRILFMVINFGDGLFRRLVQPSTLPPPECNNANDGQWCNHQVDDSAVQTLCGLVSKLLGCFGTD